MNFFNKQSTSSYHDVQSTGKMFTIKNITQQYHIDKEYWNIGITREKCTHKIVNMEPSKTNNHNQIIVSEWFSKWWSCLKTNRNKSELYTN